MSFASLYRCQYSRFSAFLWLVYYSACFLCVAYFYFLEGSGLVLAFCLVFLCCFVVFFLVISYYIAFWQIVKTFAFMSGFFLSFSLEIVWEIVTIISGGRCGAGVLRL